MIGRLDQWDEDKVGSILKARDLNHHFKTAAAQFP
jgi:hypothetical protein